MVFAHRNPRVFELPVKISRQFFIKTTGSTQFKHVAVYT
ncbi:hypothetical protein AGR1B_Cc90179 [Agrobacterium fabacearum S56]|nr:hypothetical protein AGR1B_Cc90179 [Agrobacterium fabacearum S56]